MAKTPPPYIFIKTEPWVTIEGLEPEKMGAFKLIGEMICDLWPMMCLSALGVGALVGLVMITIADQSNFERECAKSFSPAQCSILDQEHADATSAQIASGFAVGFVAGSVGGRR